MRLAFSFTHQYLVASTKIPIFNTTKIQFYDRKTDIEQIKWVKTGILISGNQKQMLIQQYFSVF